MTRMQFVQDRRAAWGRFEKLVARFERVSARRMEAAELAEFSRLLRELSHDLAVIRSRDWGGGLPDYLNDLIARGHDAFYGIPTGSWARTVSFLAGDFAVNLRRYGGYFLVATALFFLPLGVSWAVIQRSPELAQRVLPVETLENFDAMYSSDEEEAENGEAVDEDEEPSGTTWQELAELSDQRATMAGFYIQHNVGIALQCFGRGLLLGYGTVFTLLYNGITIGAVAGYMIAQGHSEKFLSFVVTHGSFELTAIAVAGGAGLLIGDTLLHPGQHRRFDALRVHGLKATELAGGAAVMLVIAALIEGFWSPAPFPPAVKYTAGAILWSLVFLYLLLAGRRR